MWLVILVGFALRVMRLDWQTLWWDEGYSVYFGTEPFVRMTWLTARDIHPPLYYALLHMWFSIVGDTGAPAARLFSILAGTVAVPLIAWTAHSVFPARRWLPIFAAILLAVSPFHIFYSQEVRMYGLAVVSSLAATGYFVQMVEQADEGRTSRRILALYVAAASVSLLTLYYTGFLLLAHQVIALVRFRRSPAAIRRFLVAAVWIAIVQFPWWLYIGPKLFSYVADKVIADEDRTLGLLPYLWRHLVAMAGGHVVEPGTWTGAVLLAGPVLAFVVPAALLGVGVSSLHERNRNALRSLGLLITIPVAVAFAVSLRLPFFPEGGERLLLFVLPYGMILVAFALDALWARPERSALAWLCVAIPAGAGIVTYYTVPRHVDDDYRPIVRFVTQHGREADTVIALFPWQVGYWRAYSTRDDNGVYLRPQPEPVDQGALTWSEAMARDLDFALQHGTVWFPAPLSFGSKLPEQIEAYLAERAANAGNRWFGPATRLGAWVSLAQPAPRGLHAQFGPLELVSAAVVPVGVASANEPVHVDLTWRAPADRSDLAVTIRIVDEQGRTWAQRDISPPGSYPAAAPPDAELRDRVALLLPVGTPPGEYRVLVGVGRSEDDQLIPVHGGSAAGLLPLETLFVHEPAQAIDPARLPANALLSSPVETTGIRLFGYAAPSGDPAFMAGTSLSVDLFVQATGTVPPERRLSVSLLDAAGESRAAWQGWPLPSYPPVMWKSGALVRLPLIVDLPADMPAGPYRIWADIDALAPGGEASLSRVRVFRRATSDSVAVPAHPLPNPVQFGTHAVLLGFAESMDQNALRIVLYWRIEQTLLPQHHISVHLYSPDGRLIAQQDGPPDTDGSLAPTGSWLPGEHLSTVHPIDLGDDSGQDLTGWTVAVGLYRPDNGTPLPTSADGIPTGDSARLVLP